MHSLYCSKRSARFGVPAMFFANIVCCLNAVGGLVEEGGGKILMLPRANKALSPSKRVSLNFKLFHLIVYET